MLEAMYLKVLDELNSSDQKIVQRIKYYVANESMPLLEKVRLARLIAVMDLEHDESTANSGTLPAGEVLRVADFILQKLNYDIPV